ncbi:MAG: hypothetical protein EA421_14455 [Gemmatimonadales bacterium]|nr:MAG: hypothetical protein EA421_14455 [Gemmatimonadales bacterium]
MEDERSTFYHTMDGRVLATPLRAPGFLAASNSPVPLFLPPPPPYHGPVLGDVPGGVPGRPSYVWNAPDPFLPGST